GDWAVHVPGVTPGGWPFEFYNDQYPDTDDTAVVLCALDAAGHRRDDGSKAGAAMARALDWLRAMQGSDGGYAAFDRDNNRHWVERLPISDFGEVLDLPSPDVTAHVLEAFTRCGGDELARRRALIWLRASEEEEGAYFGRLGGNYVYGGAAAATALAAAGERADKERLLRLGRWVQRHLHPTGASASQCSPTTIRATSAGARRPHPRPAGRCCPCSPPWRGRASWTPRGSWRRR
ncbi:squalene--hopene cyclase, partial [mine drainage metagenome]